MTLLAWLTAIYFAWEQNSFFGWNAFPHSEAEVVADGISGLLFIVAAILTKLEEQGRRGTDNG